MMIIVQCIVLCYIGIQYCNPVNLNVLLQYMKEGIELDTNTVLEPDERNLLSVAYKNVVGQKRSAFRCLTGISVRIILCTRICPL